MCNIKDKGMKQQYYLALLDPNLEELVSHIPVHVHCGNRPLRHLLLRQNQGQIL
jgi:hypothetical protein